MLGEKRVCYLPGTYLLSDNYRPGKWGKKGGFPTFQEVELLFGDVELPVHDLARDDATQRHYRRLVQLRGRLETQGHTNCCFCSHPTTRGNNFLGGESWIWTQYIKYIWDSNHRPCSISAPPWSFLWADTGGRPLPWPPRTSSRWRPPFRRTRPSPPWCGRPCRRSGKRAARCKRTTARSCHYFRTKIIPTFERIMIGFVLRTFEIIRAMFNHLSPLLCESQVCWWIESGY